MWSKRALVSGLGLALLLCACGAARPPDARGPAPAQSGTEPLPARMRCLYYEREQVQGGISAPRDYALEHPLVAGMVPHHLLASDMIAGFFRLAARREQRVETVLLVSPSHFPARCGSDVVTATAGWSTPFGPVETDRRIAEALLQNNVIAAENNPDAVEYDHGAAGLIPFVRHYLPEAKVAVVLLSNKLSAKRLDEVCGELEALCADGGILLVASADCSHYLMPREAALRDEETARAVEEFDLARIAGFSDSNVDSPQALTALLATARSKDAAMYMLDHSSSPEKLGLSLSSSAYNEGITTYFVYAAALE